MQAKSNSPGVRPTASGSFPAGPANQRVARGTKLGPEAWLLIVGVVGLVIAILLLTVVVR